MKIKRQKPFSAKSDSATFQLTVFDHDVKRVLRYFLIGLMRDFMQPTPVEIYFTRDDIENRISYDSGVRKPVIGRWGYEVAKRKGWIIEQDEEHVTLSVDLLETGQGRTSARDKEIIRRVHLMEKCGKKEDYSKYLKYGKLP